MLTYLFQFPPKILIVDFQIGGDSRMVLCGEYKDVHVIGPLDLSIFISEMAFVQEMPLYITCGHPTDTHTQPTPTYVIVKVVLETIIHELLIEVSFPKWMYSYPQNLGRQGRDRLSSKPNA